MTMKSIDDIEVSGLSAPVSVSAGSGDVSLDRLTGGTDVQVSSGDITAEGLHGVVSLVSSSGDVMTDGLEAGTARLEATSGDIDASFVNDAPSAAMSPCASHTRNRISLWRTRRGIHGRWIFAVMSVKVPSPLLR